MATNNPDLKPGDITHKTAGKHIIYDPNGVYVEGMSKQEFLDANKIAEENKK